MSERMPKRFTTGADTATILQSMSCRSGVPSISAQ
jgi:hypothetical protein